MIENPVVYEGSDLDIVSRYNARPHGNKNSEYWSDPEATELKTKIKSHYIAEQGNRCCYCNRHLGTNNHRVWDIEHVASRSDYPHFLFEPLNLAASCVDCNLSKNKKDPLVKIEPLRNKRRKTYPLTSSDFRIVHPHFDAFEDHIAVGKWVYVGMTEKGKLTIYACDLLRYAERYIKWSSSIADKTFEEEIESIFAGVPEAIEIADEVIANIAK